MMADYIVQTTFNGIILSREFDFMTYFTRAKYNTYIVVTIGLILKLFSFEAMAQAQTVSFSRTAKAIVTPIPDGVFYSVNVDVLGPGECNLSLQLTLAYPQVNLNQKCNSKTVFEDVKVTGFTLIHDYNRQAVNGRDSFTVTIKGSVVDLNAFGIETSIDDQNHQIYFNLPALNYYQESQCYDLILDGKVLSNRPNGNPNWINQDLTRLCRKTTNATKTVNCFKRYASQGAGNKVSIDNCSGKY